MRYTKYFSSQPYDEGFKLTGEYDKNIFYRTSLYIKYKNFKGHLVGGTISTKQTEWSNRIGAELAKLLIDGDIVLSLGSGTGTIEKKIKKTKSKVDLFATDFYYDGTFVKQGIQFDKLDILDFPAVKRKIADCNADTVLIVNVISVLTPMELRMLISTIATHKGIKKVILYTAEEVRLVNYFSCMIKRFTHRMLGRKLVWLGFYYTFNFVKGCFQSNGLKYYSTYKPNKRGLFSGIWGNERLTVYTCQSVDVVEKILTENLSM